MTIKKILLAGVTAGALAMAGGASAHDILLGDAAAAGAGFSRASTFGPNNTDLFVPANAPVGATEATHGQLLLANEAAFGAGTSGVVHITNTLSAGATAGLPSGNILYTISLTNAVFGPAANGILPGDVFLDPAGACTGAPSVISSGPVPANASSAPIQLSNAEGCDEIQVSLPIRATGGGNVDLTTEIRTEGGTAIDGGTATRRLVTLVDGFQVRIAPQSNTDATLASNPTFSALTNSGSLGQIVVLRRQDSYQDLAATPTANGDVNVSSVVLTGNFEPFDGDGGFVRLNGELGAGGINASTRTTSNATFNNPAVSVVAWDGTATTIPVLTSYQVRVSPETGYGAIPPSDYAATVSYSLSGNYTAQPNASGDLGSIGRQGAVITVPWINTSTVFNANPLQPDSIIRVGNANARAVRVYAEVISRSGPSGAGYTNQGLQLIGEAPANGELVINRSLLQSTLGDFGRGDVRLTVEAANNTITVRRLQRNNDGGFT